MKREQLTIFTDGICYAADPEKRGGFGVYIQWRNKEYSISQGYTDTTISRMELRGILFALRSIKTDIPTTVTIYSDSRYVVDLIRKKGFLWRTKELVCDNFDLVNNIFMELDRHKKLRVKLWWIPGHGKDFNDPLVYGNFIADFLAKYDQQESYIKDSK